MCAEQFDISKDDLNPTFLFAFKINRTINEKQYHCHDFAELVFILSGKGEYCIDGQIYPVKEGDILILNPGTYHRSIATSKDNTVVEFFVAFSNFHFNEMKPNCLSFKKEGPLLEVSGEIWRKINKLCLEISEEYDTFRAGRYFMLKAYLIQLLLLLVREQEDPGEEQQGFLFESVNKRYVVKQIMNYFEDHYNEKISLDRIAENMYLSPFYISKIFKSETGNTPIHYLINIRLDKAKEMLESGAVGNIQKIAACVGYDDAYHFSKLFKKRYGVSPSQMKKK